MSSENTEMIEQYLEEILSAINFYDVNQFLNEHFRGKMTFETFALGLLAGFFI